MKAIIALSPLFASAWIKTSYDRSLSQQQLDYFERYDQYLDPARFQIDQPVVGVMMMPTDEDQKTESFPWDEYTWEHNINFVHYAGTHAVPIPHDLADEDLYPLLDQINGVYFTGGPLNMIQPDGTQHQYYKTAKKIFEYSLRQKDDFNVTWPVFGFCQGFEVIHWLVNEDRYDTLTNVRIYNEGRPLKWTVDDPKQNSYLFKDFPKSLLQKMSEDKLQYHAHDWTVASKTYKERPAVDNFFRILAVDQHKGTEFVMAVEGKDYPVFGTMHHPETQNMRAWGDYGAALNGKVNNEVTDAINFYFSNLLHQEAKRNLDTHKFEDPDFGRRMEFKNCPMGFTTMYGKSVVLTYGI